VDLTFADEQDGERRRKAAAAPDGHTSDDTKPRRKRANTPEVGHALRAAYQQTINEDIPPDLLDLLGKLG
jgi:hypothetical protein